ncbi:unnamed protein product [Dicrocoelium dendriticum]|nr:unnamed protein product [Dicrocoelium dendriticum]
MLKQPDFFTKLPLRFYSNTTVFLLPLHRCAGVLDNANFRCHGRRPRALPVVQRTDSGLHCVSIDTVAELVTDAGEKRNISFVIVDCRFPYEYEGGHIRDAINIFTHSDLVQEIFNRVPAQRPPGKSGPPKLLGGSLARRLSKAPREPLSAPCEPISDEDDSDDYVSFDHFTSEASQLELAVAKTEEQNCSVHSDDALGARSEPSLSTVSNGSSSSGSTTTYEPAFVVIFHCEFSSQRAPDLATFLRNIDRISNYHRYPFLYFPEIYIMKGGYSAFYQSYPHLCAPDNYVKMSHRDYRTQFRIYRRLTKRVSSACIACIRPQHKLLHSPIVDTVTSFDQPSVGRPTSSTVVQPTPSSTSKTCTNLLSAVVLGGEVTPSATTDAKENLPPIYVNVTKVDAPHRLSSLHSQRACDPSPTADSPVTEASMEDADSLNDSPLSLAETVVRVGQRVIAATLSATDPSLGVDNLLRKCTEQLPTQTFGSNNQLAIVRSLRRSNTDVCMFRGRASGKPVTPRRVPLRCLVADPFGSHETGCAQTTPAFGRKRSESVIGGLSIS